MSKVINMQIMIFALLIPILLTSQRPNFSTKQLSTDQNNGTPKSIHIYSYQMDGEIIDSICSFDLLNLKERNNFDTLGNVLLKETIRKSKIDSTIYQYDKETGRTIEMRTALPETFNIRFIHYYDNDFNMYYKWDSNNILAYKARYNEQKKIIETHSYQYKAIKTFEYKYDENEMLKEQKIIVDGAPYNKTLYFYSNPNRLTKKQVYDKNDTLSVIVNYEYPTINSEVVKYYDSSNELKSYLKTYRYYDHNNNLIKLIKYNPNANYSWITEFKIQYQ